MMTPSAAINHVLDSVDGIEIDGGNDEVVTTLLAAGTARHRHCAAAARAARARGSAA
jgi:hypothetical protein